jgi:branched-chain amino acid transport system permease protein
MSSFLIEITTVLVFGLAFSMLLFILSVGLSITMGLMGFANLAHGSFAMAGGYVTVSMVSKTGAPFAVALLVSFVIVALLSILFERVLYRHLYRRPELDQVLLTIGIVFASIATVTFIWGPDPQLILMPEYLSGSVDLGFNNFPRYHIFMIVAGAIIVAALFYGLERTNIGAQIRAAVDNRRMAESCGINTGRIFTWTFALGSGMAALGGGLGIQLLGGIKPVFALEYLVIFLIVIAVGGMGNIRGTFFAALILGIIDFAGKFYFPEGGAFIIFAVTIIVLLIRPHGLFGKA